jgi:hypothetical protein
MQIDSLKNHYVRYHKSQYRFWGLVLIFAVFLTPISMTVRGDSVSANYSFILFPFLILCTRGMLQVPNKKILALIFIYIIIFITCFAYQYYYLAFWERRLISFILFMSIFTFFFVKIDDQMVRAFTSAIILVSFIYSSNSIYTYFLNGGSKLGFEFIRPIVQSQRYGFILLLGFWLAVFHKTSSNLGFLAKLLVITIIFNGLGLTFSRSSVAGLLASSSTLLLLLFLKLKETSFTISSKTLNHIILCSVIAALILSISYYLIPDYFQFFSERLLNRSITPIQDGYFSFQKFRPYDTYVYNQLESSEGYRLFMIMQVITYLSANPLFGSGFLGVWIMFDDLAGASHNQLLDVLFRTGLVGFTGFIFILYKLLNYNFGSRNIAVFVSMIGILAVGMFHETFKLSQGAFIFAFLIAHAFNADNYYRRIVALRT